MDNIAIVLHKICKDKIDKRSFEDIDLNSFKFILELVKNNEFNKNKKFDHILTFDDGNISDFQIVYKELLNISIQGIFFIIPSFVGKENYLNWEMIKEMSRNGMLIGSHSLSHQDLTNLDFSQAIKEIEYSKHIIEEKTGIKVADFSFPYGRENTKLIKIAFNAGYKNVYTSRHGLFKNKSTIRPRNSINSKFNSKKINQTLFPSKRQEYKWYAEDFIKFKIKNFIGNDQYTKMRNIFIK